MIRRVQFEHRLTDEDLADRVGVSPGTIKNARGLKGNLDTVTLLSFEHEFGPGTIDPAIAPSGSRAVPQHATCNTDGCDLLPVLSAAHAIAEAKEGDSDGGSDLTHQELVEIAPVLRRARAKLDNLIARADRHLRRVA
ncbi:hypothetical protein BSL82_01190 [Tardibacter chloracetimidivorans]|uniref:Uncharacterized protein n=1 Tax=Tardibacter chloracetimidivorans TaxID=1921510 RepID=A0A1L3ZR43_9SPHN|nr:hypothetical protein [Tardibacter chloracetimidivorans]API58080.1 hypothetical protein BSL82_01190 [Tardibacter chloracetimidivorans]